MGAPVRLIIVTGLMAGTLDGTAAIIDFLWSYHGNPMIGFQFIASGILGPAAFSGGFTTALLGIGLHYCIAMSWTLLFFVSRPRFRLLRSHWLVAGIGYAMIIWIVMNLVVRPLSLVPHLPWSTFKVIKSYLILVAVVGSPIAFVADRAFRDRRPEQARQKTSEV